MTKQSQLTCKNEIATLPTTWVARNDRMVIMGFLKNLFSSTPAKPEKRYYTFNVKCNRCGEIIEGRVDLDNDLSIEYEDNREVYYVRKGLLGSGRCFQQIEVELKFSSTRGVLEENVQGGKIVE